MSETIVVTDGLTKRYGDQVAVQDVNLTVRRGEVYGFLGPNGAGKTTTLRMLLGLVRPSSGTAAIMGEAPGAPGAVARTGALIEGPGFYPYLSGRDNLRVMARYQGAGEQTVEEALARVGLAMRAGDDFRTYSLGMKQRLGVGAALLTAPSLLVLDEPTNGLDPAGMAEMRTLLKELAQQGQTVLLSSHLLSEVEEICDRVGVISGGRLLTESTVADLRGASTVYVRAEPIDRVIAAGMELAGDNGVRRHNGGAQLDLAGDRIPELARTLVSSGVDIHEIRCTERSLEDVFFEMTSGKDEKENQL